MNKQEADSGHVNPHYNDVDAKGAGYRSNCQSCVVTFEARLRGYNVKTRPNTKGSMLEKLSYNTRFVWVNPKTGNYPQFIERGANYKNKELSWLRDTVEANKRYVISFDWKTCRYGHIVTIRKIDGHLQIYDPQTNKYYNDNETGEFDNFFQNAKKIPLNF